MTSADREDPTLAEVARAYRASLPKRQRRDEPIGDGGGFTQAMRRNFIAETIGDVPRDALSLHVALEFGDDALVYQLFASIVARIRAAAPTVKELRAATVEEGPE
jgi:hypothetical protein